MMTELPPGLQPGPGDDASIGLSRIDEAEELYLLTLGDSGVPAKIKEKALNQLGLIYLAPDNPGADRDQAIGYLRQLLVQYPDSDLAGKTARHLDQALNRSTP